MFQQDPEDILGGLLRPSSSNPILGVRRWDERARLSHDLLWVRGRGFCGVGGRAGPEATNSNNLHSGLREEGVPLSCSVTGLGLDMRANEQLKYVACANSSRTQILAPWP